MALLKVEFLSETPFQFLKHYVHYFKMSSDEDRVECLDDDGK